LTPANPAQADGDIVMCDSTSDGLVCSDGNVYEDYDDFSQAVVDAHRDQVRTLPFASNHALILSHDRCVASASGARCHRVE
jgi:hypothetical protein